MASFTNIPADAAIPADLTARTQAGEVFVIRDCLQRLGLFDEIRDATLASIEKVKGPQKAREIDADGIETIHKHMDLDAIQAVTDAAYDIGGERVHDWVLPVARDLFGLQGSFYYEKSPNIRFHVPYDVLAADKATLKKFSAARGGGKLSAHPNHRDSWVGCPDNLINIWAAVAPIRKGNGLIVFPDAFEQDIKHTGASIARDENPGAPVIPELAPGDAILFQGDHLHSSVLNQIDETRHAVSFRIVTSKPNFSNGHYHHYLQSALAAGPLRPFAELPANLQWSYVATRLGWLADRFNRPSRDAAKKQPRPPQAAAPLASGIRSFHLSELDRDTIRTISDDVCVARIGDRKVIAFQRRCPHGGSDLSLGTVNNGQVACPWHDLHFDPVSGNSACASLSGLKMYPVDIDGDDVTVRLDTRPALAAE
ncbi:MAG: Rieske 2Fe-2S domain-containing protein [Marinibacterium sp.]